MGLLRNKPSFLIIGAQKAGTSSLYHYLAQHPRMQTPFRQELHFFDLDYHRGIRWYESLFPFKRPFSRTITGESSPYYLFHPLVPARVHQHYSGIKLVVLLRDPVARAYSHFRMSRRTGEEALASFSDAVAREHQRIKDEEAAIRQGIVASGEKFRALSYMRRGLYGQQIQRWFNYFARSQFLFIKSEDFFMHPVAELKVVHDFLKLPHQVPANLDPVNAGNNAALDASLRASLRSYFEEDGRLLRQLIGERFAWD